MPQERESLSFGDYAAIIKRRWRVVLATALVFMVLGGLYTFKKGVTYTSNSSIVIRPILSDPFVDNRIEDVGADTQAKVLDSTVVATTVAKRLKLDKDPKDLVNRLTVDNPVGTLILNISFAASTPERAQAGAQAFAQAYLDYRRTNAEETQKRTIAELTAQQSAINRNLADASAAIANNPPGSDAATNAEARRSALISQLSDLETQAAATSSIDTQPGEIIRPADLPAPASKMKVIVTILATGILGTLVGLGLALLRDRTDRGIRSRHDLIEVVGREPLAEIPRPRNTTAGGLPALVDPAGDEASSYRGLRVRLWPRRGTGPRRLLIAGVAPGPAPDAVGANLAVTIASSGWSTLLAWPNKTNLAEVLRDRVRAERRGGLRRASHRTHAGGTARRPWPHPDAGARPVGPGRARRRDDEYRRDPPRGARVAIRHRDHRRCPGADVRRIARALPAGGLGDRRLRSVERHA